MTKKKSEVTTKDPAIAVDEPAMDSGVFAVTTISDIRISKTNRKYFNEVKMKELTANIKEMGVAQPILIRPVTPTADEPQKFEIVAGERRFRASILAGLTTIPTMIRELTDLQAAKIQIFENLHREDPHELEEALGYQALMLVHGYSADRLAEELKKSRSYIYARLKLCSLAAPLHEPFLDNKIDASTALLLARIPVPDLQIQAYKEIVTPSFKDEPLTVREAQTHIRNRYMLDLTEATFDIKCTTLTDAPACGKCPKRTGNQPEIFTDISPDLCTDPDCFADKAGSAVANQAYQYERKNIPVFRGEDFKNALQDARNGNGDYVIDSTWITAFPRHKKDYKSRQPIRNALQKDQFGEPAAYALSDSNKFTPLYRKDVIQAELENAGYCVNLLDAFDKEAERAAGLPSTTPAATPHTENAEKAITIGAATLKTTNVDPYLERLKQEDLAKALARKEQIQQQALCFATYKRIRLNGLANFTVESLRELAKLLFSTHAFPHKLLIDLYPHGLSGSETAIHSYIDSADKYTLMNIMLDILLGEAFSYDQGTIKHDALMKIAKTEGIDVDQVRAELEQPVDAAPIKRPTISLKKKEEATA